MNRQILILTLLLIGSLVYGQNAKIKTNAIFYKYDIYSELTGFEEYTKYDILIKDKNGIRVTYIETSDPIKPSGYDIVNSNGINLGHGFHINTINKNDFGLEINQKSSNLNKKEVISYEADPTTKAIKYYYRISASENYDIRIIDTKRGKKIIKDINVDCISETTWPDNSPSFGYNSPQLLEDNYNHLRSLNENDFDRKIAMRLINFSLIRKISDEINMILHNDEIKEAYYSTVIKSKDPIFDNLDSAVIYIESGMDQIKLNRKAGIMGNHHINNALNQFKKANSIYEEFNKSEYINWFTDNDLKEKYRYGMKANLYFTSFLLSNFEKANELFNEINSKAAADTQTITAEKGDIGYGQLKLRSPAIQSLYYINFFRPYQVREERLYPIFKARFGY